MEKAYVPRPRYLDYFVYTDEAVLRRRQQRQMTASRCASFKKEEIEGESHYSSTTEARAPAEERCEFEVKLDLSSGCDEAREG